MTVNYFHTVPLVGRKVGRKVGRVSRTSNFGMTFQLSMDSDRRWELLGSYVGLPYVFLESSCCLCLSDHRHRDGDTRRSIQQSP